MSLNDAQLLASLQSLLTGGANTGANAAQSLADIISAYVKTAALSGTVTVQSLSPNLKAADGSSISSFQCSISGGSLS